MSDSGAFEIDRTRGVFETLLIAEGRPIRLAVHLARLESSLRTVFAVGPPAAIVAEAERAARGVDLGRMRIDIVPDPGEELTPAIAVSPIDPAIFFPDREHGADLRSVHPPVWAGAHKFADRDWLESVEAELGEAVPLIVAGGEVLEAGRANLFVAGDGALATPPLDGRILPGTARASLLELAADLGVRTSEEPLTLPDLRVAEEVFLTSSVRGIRPARSLDGEPLRQESPLLPRLRAALRARWLGLD